MSNIVSYKQIIDDIRNFKNSGTNDSEFNKFDFPNHKYFKILFHFGEASENSYKKIGGSNGLLHPTWEVFYTITPYYQGLNTYTGLYRYNSAWSYLMFNGEYERAERLKDFVLTLSNINSHSPWYFNSISGIDTALERKCANDGGKVDLTERKVISIACLPDAFDNRIQTLLELYRDITWSWVHKKEILPANLRKFDMSILIFESPIKFWHEKLLSEKNKDGDYCDYDNINVEINPSGKRELTTPWHTYKLLEFHDCEFSFNSLKSGFNQVNNKEGFTPTFTIDISYADCYESSYNEFMGKELGDFIISDLFERNYDIESYNNEFMPSKQENDYILQILNDRNELDIDDINNEYFRKEPHNFGNLEIKPFVDDKLNRYKEDGRTHNNSAGFSPGFVTNALGQVVEQAKNYVMNVDVPWLGDKSINDIRLGNIYGGTSISGIKSFASNLLKGNVMGSFYSIKDYINDHNKEQTSKNSNTDTTLGNIATSKTTDNVETHNVRNIGNSNGISGQQLAAAKMGKLNNLTNPRKSTFVNNQL